MKIGVITPRFALAGVPLAQIRFARSLTKRGHQVKLMVGYVDPGFTFPNDLEIAVEILDTPKVRQMFWPLVRYLRADKPDVVFSAEDHLTVIVLLACIFSGSKAKVSGSSRVLPTDRLAYSNRIFTKGWWLKQAMNAVMSRASALTCVSKDMVGLYRQLFRNAPHVWVYNIIKDEKSIQRAAEAVDHPWICNKELPVVITAGTMTKRKGFADLIRAFAILQKYRSCHLIILGNGYLRPELEQLVVALGLGECVDMPGNVDNPLKYFAKADVFVLSSYAEGLPNVLIEAMMCGCTPVSTDCPTGPSEVLQGGKYGYLVPMRNPEAMAAAIEKALDNPIPKVLLDEAVAPFDESAVIDRHFRVLGLDESITPQL